MRRRAACGAATASRSADGPRPSRTTQRHIPRPRSACRSACSDLPLDSRPLARHGVDFGHRDERCVTPSIDDREVLARLRHHAVVGCDDKRHEVDQSRPQACANPRPGTSAEPTIVRRPSAGRRTRDRSRCRVLFFFEPISVDARESAHERRLAVIDVGGADDHADLSSRGPVCSDAGFRRTPRYRGNGGRATPLDPRCADHGNRGSVAPLRAAEARPPRRAPSARPALGSASTGTAPEPTSLAHHDRDLIVAPRPRGAAGRAHARNLACATARQRRQGAPKASRVAIERASPDRGEPDL